MTTSPSAASTANSSAANQNGYGQSTKSPKPDKAAQSNHPTNHGFANTLNEAKAAFKARYQQLREKKV
jgi:hypothetical protein